jgi:hypothetical protein
VIVIDCVAIFDVYHTDQFINTTAVDEFLRQAAGIVIFGDDITAIVDVGGCIAIDGLFDTPAGRVIGIGCLIVVCRLRNYTLSAERCFCVSAGRDLR